MHVYIYIYICIICNMHIHSLSHLGAWRFDLKSSHSPPNPKARIISPSPPNPQNLPNPILNQREALKPAYTN